MELDSLQIGICEDDDTQRKNLRLLVQEWGMKKELKLSFSLFQDCESCWFEWSEHMNLDVLLLDIDLGNGCLNGMELARKIRERDKRVKIIFITALAEYMGQGYDVNAFHFLIKPIDEYKLTQVLDRALEKMEKQESYLLLEDETQTQLIPVSHILYVEAFSHSTVLYLYEDGKVHFIEKKIGMKEIESRLSQQDFFRCHRSYLVSLMHIRRIQKNQVLLRGDVSLPISRAREKALYLAFLEYHKQMGDVL